MKSYQAFPINWIPTEFSSDPCLGISHCPGKISERYGSEQKLKVDLVSIKSQNIKTIVTLISKLEIERLQIQNFMKLIKVNGLRHSLLPIGDLRVPSDADKIQVNDLISQIKNQIRLGCPVLIHCNYGFGRSGLIAALVLKALNVTEDPVKLVRKSRPGAIETSGQEQFVLKW